MARPLRIEFEGALYHVMARGNAKADIFLDDEDRQAFVEDNGVRSCFMHSALLQSFADLFLRQLDLRIDHPWPDH